MAQGADTGSPRVMQLMNKDFQKLETIYAAAEKLTQAGIRPSFNMIFGYPGRRREGAARIDRADDGHLPPYPGAEFWTNIFTPYPGAPVMERAFELGIDVPKSLEGWSDFFPRYTVLPWLKGKKHRECRPCASICAWPSIACRSACKQDGLNRLVHRTDQRPRALAAGSRFLRVPGRAVGCKDCGESSDLAAQAESGRPAAFGGTGDLLRR